MTKYWETCKKSKWQGFTLIPIRIYIPYVQSEHHQLSSRCNFYKQMLAGSNGHAMLNQWHGHVMIPGRSSPEGEEALNTP
jgi:hypothetical protein